jgi:pyruvate formate-lyase activating enzyme-like uncharacterized protein
MTTSADKREQLIARNRQEYGEGYDELRFLTAAELEQASARRRELLDALSGRVESGFGGTKLDCTSLSPGCRICGEGAWSCLFINGRCNVRCFYCPTSQDEIGLPTTNSVEFRTPADYVAYLERFGFTGAGISGGEPLLTFQRTLAFVTAIKKRFGAAMHLWLYTNGTLVDRENLARLRDAGLDEIRFDIGATAYRLDPLRLAVGTIPTVTVEIPAIAEDRELLKQKMVEMREAGVDFLNLHQLRLTPYNFAQLVSRGYRYLHGEKVTVLDSELTALELLHFAIDRQVGLPVNYCSFVFKNRYQGLAARNRNAAFLLKPHETLTDNGYIRTLTLLGPAEAILRQAALFREQGAGDELWATGSSRERLAFSPRLWPLVDWSHFRLLVGYAGGKQLSRVSYQNPFVTVKVSAHQQIILERSRAARDFELSAGEAALLAGLFFGMGPLPADQAYGPLAELAGFEQVAAGLQDYF